MAFDKIEPRKKFKRGQDRYIPTRTTYEVELELQKAKLHGLFDADETAYTDSLCRAIWGTSYKALQNAPILNFSMPKPTPIVKKVNRFYSLENSRILNAPNMCTDFYYNPLCWGQVIYIGIGNVLYSYDPASSTNQKILEHTVTTASSYNQETIAQADETQTLRLIDARTHQIQQSIVRGLFTAIVPDEANHGFYMIDRVNDSFAHYDMRSQNHTSYYFAGAKPVGLAFNNRYTVVISEKSSITTWDIRKLETLPVLKFNGHITTSKTISFSPYEDKIVASGGGTADKTVKIWDTTTGKIRAEENAQAQICSIHWINKHGFFATEGFSSNRVSCWPLKEHSVELEVASPAHQDRVLFSAQNPVDPTQIVTASPDETIRFWSVKTSSPKENTQSHHEQSTFTIR